MSDLRAYIEEVIAREGAIPFSRFMRICLYGEPESPPGFYASQREQFGKAGDFYTASDVHAVFGRLLCRQFEQMWRAMGSPHRLTIVELGPGRGLCAEDLIAWAGKKYGEFAGAMRYSLVEASASLRDRLRRRFEAEIVAERVAVFERMEEAFACTAENVIVFANEFFDALPTEVLDARGEVRVDVLDGEFVETFAPATPEVRAFVEKYAVQPEQGERVDAPLLAHEYMERIAGLVAGKCGYCLFVDYGYVRQEMFARRHLGTVTSFRRHTIADSPYHSPGEQDITVHVNFTALADAARQHGLDPLAWITQAQFLMGIGEESQFAEAFEECRLPQEHAKRALQLKRLIAPEGMGESFHVLVLAANLDKEKAAQLDGLKFVRPSNQI